MQTDFVGQPGISQSRSLTVSGVQLSSRETALRVDSSVIYLVPRPASEVVPNGTASVTIDVENTASGESSSYVVGDPAKIDKIVYITDTLPAAQPGLSGCPAGGDENVQVTFSDSNGNAIAASDTSSGGCGGVEFSIDGQPQPTLTGGDGYINNLESVLGTSFQ